MDAELHSLIKENFNKHGERLVLACITNNIEEVKKLVHNNNGNEWSNFPLHFALYSNNIEIVDYLLEQGIDSCDSVIEDSLSSFIPSMIRIHNIKEMRVEKIYNWYIKHGFKTERKLNKTEKTLRTLQIGF